MKFYFLPILIIPYAFITLQRNLFNKKSDLLRSIPITINHSIT